MSRDVFAPGRVAFAALSGRSDAANDLVPADALCLCLLRDDAPRARATLFVVHDLTDAPGATGLIGHYEALDSGAGSALLLEARRRLAERGVARVLGPMNGSTWMRYRLALAPEAGDPTHEPPFFGGELRNPADYPAHFEQAGFSVVSEYESRIEDLAAASDSRYSALDLETRGVRLRAIDPARFDAELEALYVVSLEGFRDNLFHSPLALPAFRALYEPFRGRFDPGLVLLAEAAGSDLVGYLFAYPDPVAAQAGKPGRVILKTMAVVPAARGLRIGSVLIDRARELARERGIKSAIYALMRSDNLTRGMSERRAGAIFRRYALYQWTP